MLFAGAGGRWVTNHRAGKAPQVSLARTSLPPEAAERSRPAGESVAPAWPAPSASVSSRRPRAIVALGTESVAHALDRLGALARSGDAQAAFDVYEMADFCAIPSDVYRSTLRSLPMEVFTEVRATLESDAEDQIRICSGTTPAQLEPRLAYLQIAADRAVPGAAERLLEAGLPGQPAYNDPNDPIVKEWVQNAVELVRRDAVGGDLDALLLLASLYRSGDLVARNSAEALVYQLAAEELMAAQSQKFTRAELELEQKFTDRHDAAVSIDESNAAKSAALDLVARCCSQMTH